MIVRNLITDGILPLKPEDSCRDALEYMEDLSVTHLPLVYGKKYVALVSDFDIYNSDNLDKKMSELSLSFQPFVYDYQHVYDALKLFNEHDLTLLPVLDEYDNYLGTINQRTLIHYLTSAFSVLDPGGVIVLEMSSCDYMLSEIARIVESNDAKILSLMMHVQPDSTKLCISIKLNKIDIAPILQTFNRFNYNIVTSFSERSDYDDLRDRYDEFIKYLNI
jgi:Predicted transcriptional regulator, contains C-terminal CBS domains